MISKADLLASLERECDIRVHLHGKIPPGGLDFRFTEGQRDTRELLQYLSFCGVGFTAAMVTGDWTIYTEGAEKSGELLPESFPAAMEEQKARIVAAGVAGSTLLVGVLAVLFAVGRMSRVQPDDPGAHGAGLGLIAAALAFGLLTNALLRR